MSAFDTCYPSLIREEGGFVDDPDDAGGVTNLGVTKGAWESWVGHSVSIADMRALTPAIVAPFYRARYWNAAHCDSFPVGLALCLFHASVNAGAPRAAMLLQGVVGATPDGAIGPGTLAAYQKWAATRSVKLAVGAFQDALRAYYRSRPKFWKFGRGWLNRAAAVQAQALGIIA